MKRIINKICIVLECFNNYLLVFTAPFGLTAIQGSQTAAGKCRYI